MTKNTKIDYKEYVKTIPNYPKEGIMFRDVTPLMQYPEVYKQITKEIAEYGKKLGAEIIAGPESRGFMFGCPVATEMGAAFVPVRKPGKLPREQVTANYTLEYGTNTLCMHKDAIQPGQKVLIVDDLLATGGTTEAVVNLIRQLGGEIVGAAFVIELIDLKGRDLLKGIDILSLCQYEGE